MLDVQTHQRHPVLSSRMLTYSPEDEHLNLQCLLSASSTKTKEQVGPWAALHAAMQSALPRLLDTFSLPNSFNIIDFQSSGVAWNHLTSTLFGKCSLSYHSEFMQDPKWSVFSLPPANLPSLAFPCVCSLGLVLCLFNSLESISGLPLP